MLITIELKILNKKIIIIQNVNKSESPQRNVDFIGSYSPNYKKELSQMKYVK